jgi:hypothetical protein
MALITLALTSIGGLTLLIRNRKLALMVISPFVVVAIVSALHRYPLKDRFMLFLIPFALLLLAEGLRGIYWLAARWNPAFAAVFSGVLALAVIWQIAPITYEKAVSGTKEDIRPVLVYVAENRGPGDIIYVFYRSDTVFRYYAPFYGLDSGNFLVGASSPSKRVVLQNYEDDISKLVGNERVWFLFSEVVDCNDCPEEDTLSFYLDYIDRVGTMVESFRGFGASAYLYNLLP